MATSTSWKRDFASGLIVLLPLLVTIYVILYLYSILASAAVIPAIDAELLAALGLPSGNSTVELARVFTTLIIFILIVFSIGYLMRTAFGDIVERAIDDAMNTSRGFGWCTTPRRWRSKRPSRGPRTSRRR